MSASTSKSFETQVQEDLLQCPICCSRFANPRALKCQHTFCYRCLQGCLKNAKGSRKVLKCAVCRKDTPLTKNGITDIPKNLVVAGLLQMIKKTGVVNQPKTNKTKNAEKPKSSKAKNETKKTTSDKNQNLGERKKQPVDAKDREFRKVYRREYTPTDDDYSSSSESDDSSSSDGCCCSCCCCCDSSSFDDSTSSSSYDDTTEYSDCSPLTPKMKNMGFRRKRSCAQRGTACSRESDSSRTRQSKSVCGRRSGAPKSKSGYKRN